MNLRHKLCSEERLGAIREEKGKKEKQLKNIDELLKGREETLVHDMSALQKSQRLIKERED